MYLNTPLLYRCFLGQFQVQLDFSVGESVYGGDLDTRLREYGISHVLNVGCGDVYLCYGAGNWFIMMGGKLNYFPTKLLSPLNSNRAVFGAKYRYDRNHDQLIVTAQRAATLTTTKIQRSTYAIQCYSAKIMWARLSPPAEYIPPSGCIPPAGGIPSAAESYCSTGRPGYSSDEESVHPPRRRARGQHANAQPMEIHLRPMVWELTADLVREAAGMGRLFRAPPPI